MLLESRHPKYVYLAGNEKMVHLNPYKLTMVQELQEKDRSQELPDEDEDPVR